MNAPAPRRSEGGPLVGISLLDPDRAQFARRLAADGHLAPVFGAALLSARGDAGLRRPPWAARLGIGAHQLEALEAGLLHPAEAPASLTRAAPQVPWLELVVMAWHHAPPARTPAAGTLGADALDARRVPPVHPSAGRHPRRVEMPPRRHP